MADRDVQAFFTNTINRDLLNLLTGKVINHGVARTVYECKLVPDTIVKIETRSKSFQNVLEWTFWNTWEDDKDIRRWLAPCVEISPCGTILIQKRTTPAPLRCYPAKMPGFLTDMKRSNYGLYKGRLVCHDYGLVVSSARLTMRKAHWWDEGDGP